MHATRDAHDAALIASAEYFTATVFLGRAKYDTVRHLPNVEAARTAGRALCEKNNKRMAMIYAVKGNNDAFVENVER